MIIEKAGGVHAHALRNESDAVFVKIPLRSLVKILYSYMQDHGYEYNHKLPEFSLILTFEKFFLIDFQAKNDRNSDFLYFL